MVGVTVLAHITVTSIMWTPREVLYSFKTPHHSLEANVTCHVRDALDTAEPSVYSAVMVLQVSDEFADSVVQAGEADNVAALNSCIGASFFCTDFELGGRRVWKTLDANTAMYAWLAQGTGHSSAGWYISSHV